MDAYRTFGEFLTMLQQAVTTPRPENENWKDLISRISEPGRIVEVNEETFMYFLEVLPPKYQSGNLFAFAEGDPIRIFWRKSGRFFCRQLTWDETVIFCRLIRIALP